MGAILFFGRMPKEGEMLQCNNVFLKIGVASIPR